MRQLVVEGAEGNPYYVEELIKVLIEDGVIVPGVEAWSVIEEWLAQVRELAASDHTPVTISRLVAELRAFLDRDAIVLTSSGNVQAQVFQEMAFTLPRTYLPAGGFSTMGWAFPAALGAKLAAPTRPVVAMAGDGDFLMTFQEIATAVQYNIPVVAIVLNNQGWQAIRDLQIIAFGDDAP